MADDLEHRRLRGVTVSRRVEAPPWRVDVADPTSLHVVVQGSFYLSRGEPRAIRLDPGDLVILGPGESRLYCIAPSPEATRVEPAELLSASYESSDPALQPLLHLSAADVQRDRGLTAILGLLRAALTDSSANQAHLAHSLLEPLLTYALNCHATARSGGIATISDERIARAIRLMQAKPAQRWDLASLARAAGLSRAAFARRFQAETGIPPLRYLTDLRMRIAAALLTDGDEALAAIAAQIGYESEFAFSRAFKRHTGEAPGAFRRAHRSGGAAFRQPPTRAAA